MAFSHPVKRILCIFNVFVSFVRVFYLKGVEKDGKKETKTQKMKTKEKFIEILVLVHTVHSSVSDDDFRIREESFFLSLNVISDTNSFENKMNEMERKGFRNGIEVKIIIS